MSGVNTHTVLIYLVLSLSADVCLHVHVLFMNGWPWWLGVEWMVFYNLCCNCMDSCMWRAGLYLEASLLMVASCALAANSRYTMPVKVTAATEGRVTKNTRKNNSKANNPKADSANHTEGTKATVKNSKPLTELCLTRVCTALPPVSVFQNILFPVWLSVSCQLERILSGSWHFLRVTSSCRWRLFYFVLLNGWWENILLEQTWMNNRMFVSWDKKSSEQSLNLKLWVPVTCVTFLYFVFNLKRLLIVLQKVNQIIYKHLYL